MRGRLQNDQRIAVIDAIRSLALLGVVVMNLKTMSGLGLLPPQTQAIVQSGSDIVTDVVLAIFVDGKALSAFSFLFGLSFTLLLSRTQERNQPFVGLYLRRLIGLALFGALNFTLFFWGDILTTYALLGLLLLPFTRLSQPMVLTASIGLLVGGPAAAGLVATVDHDVVTGIILQPSYGLLAAFGGESLATVIEANMQRYFSMAGSPPHKEAWEFTNTFGLFLLGLWVGRENVARRLGSWQPRLRLLAATTLPVGIVINSIGLTADPTGPVAAFALIGVPLLAIGYVSLAALLLQRASGRSACALLAPAGQMALTNYLAYALLGQLVFYGYGLDLVGRAGTMETTAIAIAIYAVLVAVSHWWMHRFVRGPAEWLWRWFTYGRRPALRRSAAS